MTSTFDSPQRAGREIPPEERVLGYRRNKNRFGIRNHIAVVPTVFCANRVAAEIASGFEDARWGTADENRVLHLGHTVGCCSIGFDEETAIDVLMGLAQNPNVGGVLLVHLGCGQLCSECGSTGKPVGSGRLNLLLRSLSSVLKADTIIHAKGSLSAIEDGRQKVARMIEKLEAQERTEFHVGNLAIGVMNGSSDPTSGLFANPAVGHFSDWLLSRGGRVAFSQTVEMLGAEDAVLERLGDEHSPARQRSVRHRVESQLWRTTAMRVAVEGLGIESEPTPGNRRGGISTLAEKSIGTLFKIGHDAEHSIVDVLPHGKSMSSKGGIHLVDGPGQDVLCLTA
ncbi:MAG: UxaA family hydrolase, partial [Planctomycetota bacterium]